MNDQIIREKRKCVSVVVLGDIGRSPRMQYHALSLAKCGLLVHLIGYPGSNPLPQVLEHENINIIHLVALPNITAPKMVMYFLKSLWQFVSLLITLFLNCYSDFVLCQNPPSIPTIPACWIYCLIMRSKFIIDWHNYAYSILALSLSEKHPLLTISKWIEKYFGRMSSCNLCVTQAMKNDLEENWNISAKVLYDRPPEIFHPINIEEKHIFFTHLAGEYEDFASAPCDTDSPSSDEQIVTERTAFTQVTNNVIELRPDRPALLFSSTSWTPDEDFQILLDALQVYETSRNEGTSLPKLICVITGKGPMKDYYKGIVESRKWKSVKVVTPWLEAAEYPKMVASADLGVCLHTSSSGLDLPMKVVDMFGAGLPVCAFTYPCLAELVKDGVNGYTFGSATELSTQIIKWFTSFPKNRAQIQELQKFKKELEVFQKSRWEDNWNRRAKKMFVS